MQRAFDFEGLPLLYVYTARSGPPSVANSLSTGRGRVIPSAAGTAGNYNVPAHLDVLLSDAMYA